MNLKPSAITMMAGGVLLFVSTFIDWVGGGPYGANGLETDAFGLLGIIVLLVGLAVAGLTAATTFGNVKLPEDIMGFTMDQVVMELGIIAFVPTFALQFASNSKFGLTLAWLSAAAIVVGSVLKQKGN
ncbi:MAG: hypothetical protein GY708_07835 [Actinomycetia bacterium]|nr:hypothetical protein [Actinomycetes bacterium]MCP4963176.1 hypothetical protein [Actinomycetes bacterium]